MSWFFSKRLFALFFLLLSSLSQAVGVDQPAPGFTLGGMANITAGQKLSLDDYRGKVVYLDFWASWCGPCRKSLPALNQVRNKYHARGFEVIAVNVDENPDDGLKFLRDFSVNYPIVYDPKGSVPAAYELKGMPYAFIIDRTGLIRHIHEGYRDGDKEKIEILVEHLLNGKR